MAFVDTCWWAVKTMQSDRISENSNLNLLMAAASDTEELTIMAVPINSAIRLGIDRDMDGAFDGDENPRLL